MNPFGLPCSEVLRHKSGEAVSKVLYRHIGKGVNFHCRRKGRHDCCSKTVHQSLHHQNAQIHHRLLQRGEEGKLSDLLQNLFFRIQVPEFQAEFRQPEPGIHRDSNTGNILRNHRCNGGPFNAPGKPQHKPQVQHHIQHGTHGQKQQRHHGISHCPQKGRKIIIEKGGRNSPENPPQVFPHQRFNFFRNLKQIQNLVHQAKNQQIQHYRCRQNQDKGSTHTLSKAFHPFFSISDGKQRAAAHTQSQQNRGEKGHEGIGRSHRRQCAGTEKLAYNQGIRNIVKLLQQVPGNHWQGKQQNGFGNGPLCQIFLHSSHRSFPNEGI